MKKLLTTFLLIFALVFCGLSFGCNKTKAMKTIRDAENRAAESLIYIRNIAKANNDAFQAGDISSSIHKPVNTAAGDALKAVNAFVQAINAAKAAVAAGADPNGQVDLLKALFNSQTVTAVLDLVSSVAVLPPGLRDKLGTWAMGLQAAIVAFRVLFSELEMEVNNQYAG